MSGQPETWRVVVDELDPDGAIVAGSNLLVGNGFLGYRGTSPEQLADDYVALVVAGTYDCADGHWRELTTAPNPLFVAAEYNGTPIGLAGADDAELSLDLRSGEFTLTSTQTIDGVRFNVGVERFASLDRLEVLAQRWTITADADVTIDARCGIDGDVWSLNGQHLPTLDNGQHDDTLTVSGVTVESEVDVVVSLELEVFGTVQDTAVDSGDRHAHRTLRIDLPAGTHATVDSIATIRTSNSTPSPYDLGPVRAARSAGYDELRAESRKAWATVWDAMDVTIEGAPGDQLGVRFAAYHNRICTPAHDEHLPIGARGLSCQAYQGAAFWDQEIYNLPAFLFTEPEIARSLLAYRHHTLDGARRKAERLGYAGAFFAWISGDTGDELCPDFFFRDVITGRPIRTHFNDWQIHVAPDIVTAIARYLDVTGDREFLLDHGAEIIFEVARFLHSFVRYDELRQAYHCIRLLGPDEWHENVDNNAFTNHQVQAALSHAVGTWELLMAEHPARLDELAASIDLSPGEVDGWVRVRDHILLPKPDPDGLLIEQFDGFFDLEDVSPDELRTRLIEPTEYWGYPNGVAVHTQVSKQADVPMLLWLHASKFDTETMRANYDYYEPRCSHGSSLSHAAFGMLALRAGDAAAAHRHFLETARVDLDNTQHAIVGGTFIGGIHTAACGGTYQLVTQGFGGLGFADGRLTVDPLLPAAWAALRYPVNWRGSRLDVSVLADGVTVTASESNPHPVPVSLCGQEVVVDPGSTVEI